MPAYRLHYFPESGNSYKLALMLTLCGQAWEPVWTDFVGGQTRSPEWRAAVNEMGEIPVLEEDGLRLTQTGAVLLRLAERHGRFGGGSEPERFEILRWLLWDNHKLTSYVATYRFMSLFQKKTDDPVTQFFHARAVGAFKVLDAHLAGRDFIVSGHPTIADLSICGYLFWPDQIGMDLKAYPNIAAWLDRIAALAGY